MSDALQARVSVIGSDWLIHSPICDSTIGDSVQSYSYSTVSLRALFHVRREKYFVLAILFQYSKVIRFPDPISSFEKEFVGGCCQGFDDDNKGLKTKSSYQLY